MTGKVLNAIGTCGREVPLRNHLDGSFRYPKERSDGRVFDATDGGEIGPLLHPEYCPHTDGSTAYNESASG